MSARSLPGDVVCLPDGPDGARRLSNHEAEAARAILLSTNEIPSVREYLDRRMMMVRYSREYDAAVFPIDDFGPWEGGRV